MRPTLVFFTHCSRWGSMWQGWKTVNVDLKWVIRSELRGKWKSCRDRSWVFIPDAPKWKWTTIYSNRRLVDAWANEEHTYLTSCMRQQVSQQFPILFRIATTMTVLAVDAFQRRFQWLTHIVPYSADILSNSSDSFTRSESRSTCFAYWSVQNGSVYRLG